MQRILNEDSKANIIYINMEDMAFENLKTASDLSNYVITHLIEEKTIADAILDRIIHSAIRFELQGESMRKKMKRN